MDSSCSSCSEGAIPSFKIIVLGNGSVGKSSLIQCFCKNFNGVIANQRRYTHNRSSTSTTAVAYTNSGSFDPSGNWRGQYNQTVGVDFYSKRIELPCSIAVQGGNHNDIDKDNTVQLHLWDVGGQQIGGTMLANYIYDCDAVCLVYDVTNANSFKDVEDWLACVRRELAKHTATAAVGAAPLPGTSSPTQSMEGASASVHTNTLSMSPASTVTPATTSLTASSSTHLHGAASTTTPWLGDANSNLGSNTSAHVAQMISSVLKTPGREASLVPGATTTAVAAAARRRRERGPVIALVGTKNDTPLNTHVVPRKAHDSFVQTNHLDESFLVSSRTGDGVPGLFLKLTADVLGHEVRQQDLDIYGFANAAVVAPQEAYQPPTRSGATPLRSTEYGDFRNGLKDERLSVVRRPDDCTVM